METVDLQNHMSELVEEAKAIADGIRQHPRPGNVHQLRICLRRIRTCLSLVDRKLHAKDRKALKKLWHQLGEVRDLDVVKKLSEDNKLPVKNIRHLRRDERHALVKILSEKRVHHLFRTLEKIAAKFDPRKVTPHLAVTKLRSDLIRTPASPQHLHDIRIILKKIRYLREAFGFSVEMFRGIQNMFGEFQDYRVLASHHPGNPIVARKKTLKEEAVLFILKEAFGLAFRGLDEMISGGASQPHRQVRAA